MIRFFRDVALGLFVNGLYAITTSENAYYLSNSLVITSSIITLFITSVVDKRS